MRYILPYAILAASLSLAGAAAAQQPAAAASKAPAARLNPGPAASKAPPTTTGAPSSAAPSDAAPSAAPQSITPSPTPPASDPGPAPAASAAVGANAAANTGAPTTVTSGMSVKDNTGALIGEIKSVKDGVATITMGSDTFAVETSKLGVSGGAATINATQADLKKMLPKK
ncbi:MAG: hypothetical protein ACJ798_05720 [Phenylobacterium sp.]